MKNILKMIAVAMLISFLVPISANATTDETLAETTVYVSGDYEYTLNENNEAIITAYNGSEIMLDIPSAIDGYTVVEIGEKAFYENDVLEAVNIPDTVKVIGLEAFSSCSNLADVKLSKNLSELWNWAFYECTALTEIEIPISIENITGRGLGYNDGPFSRCTNLKTVVFEKGITKIIENLFQNCTGLEEIVIPDTVKVIEKAAFSGCTNLKGANLPSGLEEIGSRAFESCALTSVNIPKSLHTVILYDEYQYFYGPFYGCQELKTVTFDEGITKIIASLFAGCTGVEEVSFPNNIIEIDDYAFIGCDGLKEIVLPNTIERLGKSVFEQSDNLQSVILSNNLNVIGHAAFSHCTSLTEISIPDSVIDIGPATFNGCSQLKNVRLPENCEKIPWWMFYKCISLKTIEVPTNLKVIEISAFEGSGLEKITLPDGLKEIHVSAFSNCDSLTAISIPDSVTVVYHYAFDGCDALKDIQIGNGITDIRSAAFARCSSLEKIILPHQIEAVWDDAFEECPKLTEIVIPNLTTYIWDEAFTYPEKMTVYGTTGSEAEEWAEEQGATFVPYEKETTGITAITKTLTLDKGETSRVVYAVTPIDSTDVIEWTSSNESVATVSKYGNVTAVGGGTATITAKVGDLTATCEVTVIQENTPVYVEIEGSADENTSFEIYDANGNKVTSTDISGSSSSYPLADLPAGTYTMKVSKDNYVPRTYTIEVGTETVQLDVDLHKTGDITGDDVINARDKKMLYNHIAGTAELVDYDFTVGDVTGDNVLNARDKKMIYNHIAGTSSLWE